MNEYKNDPGNDQDNKERVREGGEGLDSSTSQNKNNFESQAPKKKHFNVLNEDGSLADLPDQDVEGSGALEGTIGQ